MKDSIEKYIYRYLLIAALSAITLGTIFYHFVEDLSWLDAYYFSVVSLTTVGYGDIYPHTPAGKIFTTFYLLFGIGIITTFISFTLKRRGEKFGEKHNLKDPRTKQ